MTETGNDIVETSDMEASEQERILTTAVIFQGVETTLRGLLTPTRFVDFDEVIDSELLSKLANNEEISVGKSLIDNTPSCYIPRRFIYDDNEISEEKLCEYNEKPSWHVTETICAPPGSGKSTVLDHLALMMKERYPRLWVIKIDLNDYSHALSRFKKNNTKSVTVMDLLNSRPESEIKSGLERKIFSIRQKVMLLVDGIDEVCSDYIDIVKSITSNFRDHRCFAKVFETISKNLNEELQSEFSFENTLIPFLEKDQINLFVEYLRRKLDTQESIDRSKIFAKELARQKWIEEKGMLIGSSLKLKMLAEIYEDQMKWQDYYEFLTVDNSKSTCLKQISLTKLFLLFIHKKYSKNETILDENKLRKDIANINKECCSYLYGIALGNILSTEHCKLFNCYERVAEKIPEEIEEKLLEIGIVRKVNGFLRFFHRTVAEYMVAECIANELCDTANKGFFIFFIKEILSRRQYTVIRSFCDSVISTYVKSIPDKTLKELGSIVPNNEMILFDLLKDGYSNIFNLIVKCLEVGNIDVDFDVIRSEGNTLLQAAISADQSDSLKLLIEKGVSVNNRDNTERTALYDAVSKNNLNAVKFLVQQGAEVHCRDIDGRTPLHEAGFSSSVDVVEYLLAHGAVIDSKDRQGCTCLHEAAKSGDVDKVKCLVENGADIDSLSKKGTPICLAVRNEHVDVVKYLVEKEANLTSNNTGASLLHAPEKSPYDTQKISKEQSETSKIIDLYKVLIEGGADVNATDNKGNNVLQSHIDADDKRDLVVLLVESGAHTNKVDKSGLFPLDKAIQQGAFNTVKYLMEKGVTQYRKISFFAAVRKGYLAIVEYLVENGTNLNIKDDSHYSPLQIAARESHVEMVKFFVEKGAEFDAKSVELQVESALRLAINNCDYITIKCLAEQGANTAEKLELAVITGNLALVQSLEANGATVKEIYDVGNNVELLKNFFEKGVKVNMPYMLHQYAATGNLDIIRYLVDKGVDVNYEDYSRTALHEAAKYNHFHVVKFLVKRGARVDIRDLKNETPLEKAIRHGNIDIADFLLQHSDVEQVLNDIHQEVLRNDCRSAFEKLSFILKHGAQLNLNDKPQIDLFSTWLGLCCFGIPELLVEKSNGDCKTVVDMVRRFMESHEDELLDEIFSRWDTIKYLLERGLQFDVTQMEKYDFLTKAAWVDDLKFVKYLVEKGVDVNRKDKDGNTALHKAYHFDVVKYLVKVGADVNARGNHHKTVLHHAIENLSFNICRYLIENGASVNNEHKNRHSVLYSAAIKGSFSKVKYLVDKGMKLTEKDCNTILHNVIGFNDLDLVKYLVENGAQVEGKYSAGRTVIYKAVENNNLDIVKYLVVSGASVKVEDNKSVTLYEYASKKSSPDIVKYLALNGARYNKKSQKK